ncbi:4,5-DOPA dioxygenase extradiol [Marinoscillum furvescens DSM 4134]|uniref:4,5-DOPA dioxygenase extradiol n=2 Tax=Marinoscillum furvescens TaxID=1026 RepID=A0A3D9L2R6_MARFU|nr:4,5-DOPA dioxygenase extradiol [Marinoscillum furvescens DSM 4134]
MKRKDFIKSLAVVPAMGTSLKALSGIARHFPESPLMPVLFVGHGNPMNAITENEITRGWRQMAKGLEPTAVLCVSAHWETKGSYVTMSSAPRTIHDFGGFPKELFEVQYPAPGAPELAREVISSVKNRSVQEDHDWGLDHGTWSVLIKMFPEANVPVFQLSLDTQLSPKEHYQLAQELQGLRRKGVLIVGSGNIVHNLRAAKWDSNEPYDWALDFDEQVKSYIQQGTHDLLQRSEQLSPEARLAIPTPEHYLPLLYALALQQKDEPVSFFNETIEMGSMAMRSFVIGGNA